MGHHHLRVLLEIGGHDAQRNALLDGVEGLQQIAAHVEVDLAGKQQRPPADLRTALHDADVQAAGGIGAVGDRLIVAAVLGLGEPVGAEGDLFGGGCGESCQDGRERHRDCVIFRHRSPLVFPCRSPNSRTTAQSYRARGAIIVPIFAALVYRRPRRPGVAL